MKYKIYIIPITLIYLFIWGTNVYYFQQTGYYFGKNDIINYQKLNQKPDILHTGTAILAAFFGEKNFFTNLMPLIIFWGLTYAYLLISGYDFRYAFIAHVSTGLLYYYWIVGFYSQAISHILLIIAIKYNEKILGKIYAIISILNHYYEAIPYSIFLYYHTKKKKYFLIAALTIILILFTYNLDVLNYTILSHGMNWGYYTAINSLINPIILGFYIYQNKDKKTDSINKVIIITYLVGFITRNLRLSYYFLPYMIYEIYKDKNPKIILLMIITSIPYTLYYLNYHMSAMLLEYAITGQNCAIGYNALSLILSNNICSNP